MDNETEFIKNELKKKGYPLENYVQSLLIRKKWDVQPNSYFLDKDTNMGRELDMKASNEGFVFDHWGSPCILNLLVQCRRLPGNAWVFFSALQGGSHLNIETSNLAKSLNLSRYLWTFDKSGTHFDDSDMLATNYCEIITDATKSNKKVNNIWECVISLIKATSQELESDDANKKLYLKEIGSYDEFVKDPSEVVNIYYPLIVFEGKMYECVFCDDDITLNEKTYVPLFVDYQSGQYKGEFHIDVVSRERFSKYLTDIMRDPQVFNQKHKDKSKEYDQAILNAVRAHFGGGILIV